MSDFWYDPLLHGTGHQQSTTLGATVSNTAWPGGGTLGAKTSGTAYRLGLLLGATASTDTWPPEPAAPTMIFADGYDNQDHAAWTGGAGGRSQDCDCALTCPGGPRDPDDPVDSFVMAGRGYARRVHLRYECKALNAPCKNACESAKEWSNYKLGQTEFHAHRVRVVAPYTNQVGFCLVSQLGYPILKYNGMGLNLVGTTLQLYCNLGYSHPTLHYTQAAGWELRDGDHTLTVGAWHDYIWEMTYSTIWGTDGTHPTAGRLKVSHRLPETTSTWSTLYDSITAFPNGVPTRQWGTDAGGTEVIDNLGKILPGGTVDRKSYDKVGAYRDELIGNDNDFITDHRYGIAADFANAEAYLDFVV